MTDITQLIEKIKQNDQVAFEELYTEFYQMGFSLALQFVKSEVEAMDIMQDAFMTVCTKLDFLQEANKFKNWYMQIVANKCRDFLKKKNPLSFTDVKAYDEDGNFQFDIEDDDRDFQPEESADYSETVRIVEAMLNELPEDQKMCLILYYVNGLKISEIAESLDVSEATVKSRLKYGKEKLKLKVEEYEEQNNIKLRALAGGSIIPFIRWLFKKDGETANFKPPAMYFEELCNCNNFAAATVLSQKALPSQPLKFRLTDFFGKIASFVEQNKVATLTIASVLFLTTMYCIVAAVFYNSKKSSSTNTSSITISSRQETSSVELVVETSKEELPKQETQKEETSSKFGSSSENLKHTHDYYRPQHHYLYVGDGHWDGSGWREKEDWGKVFPTCTEQGFTVYVCSICEHVKYDDYVPAIGHNFSDEIEYVYPGYKVKGYSYCACEDCGKKKKIETLPVREGDLSGLDKAIEFRREGKYGGGNCDSYIYNNGDDYMSIRDLRISGSMPTITVNKEEKYIKISYDLEDGTIQTCEIDFPSKASTNKKVHYLGTINSIKEKDSGLCGSYFSWSWDGSDSSD